RRRRLNPPAHTGRGRRLHLPPALRKGREEKRREEKRREEKRREEKRRFFAGWIHFRLLIRFNRLKKRFSLMLKGGLYRVPGGVSTQYGG
ncbi:TPA: hypothetical protein ACFI9M_002080, partial [Neisseria gonorrhoeae]